jgi:hypothetical protein
VAYGARLESVLGESPRGFESPILRVSPRGEMEIVHLRPINALFSRGLTAILAFSVPTFTVLYILAVPDGSWPVVLIANLVVVAGLCFAVVSHRRLGVWVARDSIAERGFFGIRREIGIEQIGSIVRATLYLSGGAETAPQLFVCDLEGRQVIRLRGQFWSQSSMDVVSATLDVPTIVIEHARTVRELHEAHPGLLYWFERRTVLAGVLFTAALALGGLGLYALMYSLGTTH